MIHRERSDSSDSSPPAGADLPAGAPPDFSGDFVPYSTQFDRSVHSIRCIQMRRNPCTLLLSILVLLVTAVGHSQEIGFRWERSDRTPDGWMNGIGSSFNVGLTSDSVILMTTPEGLFRIVEQNEDGIISHVAELINPDVDGYFLGSIGERIYLKREGGNEVWASSDNGLSWERIIAYAPYNAVEIIGDGSVEGSKIVTYDPDGDNLVISSPTGQRLSTRKLPIRQWGLAASPAGILYIWEINPGMNDQILRSHDYGSTWISVALDGLGGGPPLLLSVCR